MDEPTRATARLSAAARPRRGEGSTSQGHPRTIFRRALERGNLLVAEATAKEIGRISLAEALELTLLIAQKDRTGTHGSRPDGCCATSRRATR